MMLRVRRLGRCLVAPLIKSCSGLAECCETCCEVCKNPAFLVLFIILIVHTLILIKFFHSNEYQRKLTVRKKNPLDKIVAQPQYSVYLSLTNESKTSSFIGSEAFKFPLLVDMPELVRRVQEGLPLAVKPINALNFSYVIHPNNACLNLSKSKGNTTLILMIKSAPDHFEARQMIRETFGNPRCWSGYNVVRLFMVGQLKQPDKKFTDRLLAEAAANNDIIQHNFVDHYFNNTIKIMASFDWITRYCSNSYAAFFLDDDYVVHPVNTLDFLKSISIASYRRLLAGYVWYNAVPVRRRNVKSKRRWFISYEEYPWPSYPPYVSAGAFFVTMPLIRDLSIASQYVRYLRFDDVFLGILLNKLLIAPVHVERIYSFSPVYPSTKGGGALLSMIATHGYSGKLPLMRTAWDDILNQSSSDLLCVLSQ